MAALNFPSSPINGQEHQENGAYYYYDSSLGAWVTALVSRPYDTSANKQIIFNDNGTANGSYGMTYDSSSNTVYFNTVLATTFDSLSDVTFKDNISEFDGLEILNNINPVSFTWKDSGDKTYGVIAQDIEKFVPELVKTNNQGVKTVSYIPLISILIDVIQKQQKEIDNIKKQLP